MIDSSFMNARCVWLSIFLPQRFYVKSTLAKFRVSKTAILTILKDEKVFSSVKIQKFTKETKFKGADTVKIADFENPHLQKLISRKIWVVEKLPNFHTVEWGPYRRTFWKGQWSKFEFNYLLLNVTEFRWKYYICKLFWRAWQLTQLVPKKGFSFYLLISQEYYETWPSNTRAIVCTSWKGQWSKFKFHYLLLNVTEFRWKYYICKLAWQLIGTQERFQFLPSGFSRILWNLTE